MEIACQALEHRMLMAGGFTLSGVVYRDVNGDNRRSAAETKGVKGVTVYVDANNDGKRNMGEPTAVSATTGKYSIAGLASGTHTVRTSRKTGLRPSRAGDGSAVVTIGTTNARLGFGFTPRARVKGTAFLDLTPDGVLGPGEPALLGVDVFIDVDLDGLHDPSEPGVLTDATGRYELANVALPAGQYQLRTNRTGAWVASPAGVFALSIAAGSDLRRDFAAMS